MYRKTLAAFSRAALLSSCLVADVAAQDARTRDSAGVRITENPARMDAPVRFRPGDKPLLEVGGLEDRSL